MTYHNAYAACIEDGIVRQVIVIPYCNDDDNEITAYCNGIGLSGTWIDTSFMGARRKNFAAVGDKYDPLRDAFIAPQPYLSWTLDDDCKWQPPTPMPDDGERYEWNEDAQEWQAVETE